MSNKRVDWIDLIDLQIPPETPEQRRQRILDTRAVANQRRKERKARRAYRERLNALAVVYWAKNKAHQEHKRIRAQVAREKGVEVNQVYIDPDTGELIIFPTRKEWLKQLEAQGFKYGAGLSPAQAKRNRRQKHGN